MVSALAQPDAELFCSAAKTQTKPERHPSTLIPGGHTSPLRHPTVLRPGAGQIHHEHAPKSSGNLRSRTPSTTAPQQPPKPIYKAYSPEATSQDPRASLVASEIEGYFTALDIPPLHVDKQSKQAHGRESPVQRCSSPPVPPKVRLDEEVQQSGKAELLQSPLPRTGPTEDGGSSATESPPAYDENSRASPPPEKSHTKVRPVSREDNLPGAAAVSAARVGGSVAGVRTDGELAPRTTHTDMPDGDASQDDNTTKEESEPKVVGDSHSHNSPPPLPPRATSNSQHVQPDITTHMPGEFPPPPKRSPSPRSSPPQNGATGAVASSATAIGAAVAIPSTDFAHGGFAQARNALGKHVQHMVYKAKEHHEQHLAKKTSAHGAGLDDEGLRMRNILVIAPLA